MAKKTGTYSIHKHPKEELFFVEYSSPSIGRTEGVHTSLLSARKQFNKLVNAKYR